MKVWDVVPNMQAIPQKVFQVINDDAQAVEENLQQSSEEDKSKFHKNNGQFLFNFYDNQDREDKCALYRLESK